VGADRLAADEIIHYEPVPFPADATPGGGQRRRDDICTQV
jgi:hypothetical protein